MRSRTKGQDGRVVDQKKGLLREIQIDKQIKRKLKRGKVDKDIELMSF